MQRVNPAVRVCIRFALRTERGGLVAVGAEKDAPLRPGTQRAAAREAIGFTGHVTGQILGPRAGDEVRALCLGRYLAEERGEEDADETASTDGFHASPNRVVCDTAVALLARCRAI